MANWLLPLCIWLVFRPVLRPRLVPVVYRFGILTPCLSLPQGESRTNTHTCNDNINVKGDDKSNCKIFIDNGEGFTRRSNGEIKKGIGIVSGSKRGRVIVSKM